MIIFNKLFILVRSVKSKMFAVKRIIRSKLSLKINLHTSSLLRCDKPENSERNMPKSKKKKIVTNTEPDRDSGIANKTKLTAKVNAKDYANFKSQKPSKVELYSDKRSQKEKLEAKKKLKTLSSEIEKEGDLNIPINEKFRNISVGKPKKVEAEVEDKLVKSAKLVASELGGDVKKTEGDILGYLKTLQIKTEKRKFKEGNADIENEIKGTYRGDFIADEEKYFQRHRPGFFRNRRENSLNTEDSKIFSHTRNQYYEDGKSDRREHGESKIGDFISGKNISGFKPLGVFKANELEDGPKLKIWDELKEQELKFEAAVPPRNYFEELIQWTEEGKLWLFPIDNDQDNELEANVDFTEHVFLEEHLEPWCPKRGPLRHFMELVLVGLAKNYHLSVEEKKDHIYWYRDYFEKKKALLQEMGALDFGKVLINSEKSNSKPEDSA